MLNVTNITKLCTLCICHNNTFKYSNIIIKTCKASDFYIFNTQIMTAPVTKSGIDSVLYFSFSSLELFNGEDNIHLKGF